MTVSIVNADGTLGRLGGDRASDLVLDSVTGLPIIGALGATAKVSDGLAALALAINTQQAAPTTSNGRSALPRSGCYVTVPHDVRATTPAVTFDRQYYYPLWMPAERSCDQWAFEVTTLLAGATGICSLYTDTGDFMAGNRIAFSTPMSCEANGVITQDADFVIPVGLSWIGVVFHGSGTLNMRCASGIDYALPHTAFAGGNTPNKYEYESGVTADPPAVAAPANRATNDFPLVGLRIA